MPSSLNEVGSLLLANGGKTECSEEEEEPLFQSKGDTDYLGILLIETKQNTKFLGSEWPTEKKKKKKGKANKTDEKLGFEVDQIAFPMWLYFLQAL